MDRSDLKVINELIRQHGNDVDTNVVKDHLLAGVNKPFFDHGGYHDLLILTTVKECWNSLHALSVHCHGREFMIRLFALGIRWAYRGDGMPDGPSKALYVYNSSLIFSCVITALEGHE